MTRIVALFTAALAIAGGQAPTPRGSGGVNRADQRDKPYVILVSFDGFGATLLDRVETPNLRRLLKEGVRAKSMAPVHPSLTFPNHYTIVTGLYPERHGIVAMEFFDPERGKGFFYRDASAVDGTWYRGEPIWATAERQGMVSAICYWAGSEASIQGIRPTYSRKFAENLSNEARVDQVLDWLRLPPEGRPHLLAAYFSDVDGAGHRFGPESAEVRSAVERMDQVIGRLLEGVAKLPVRDQVYLILVSDHGMAKVTREQTIPIESLIDLQGIEGRGAGSQMQLWVKEGAARAREVRDTVNSKIQHGRAYLRADIPARLHYRADPRIGDIVILMEEPWRILPPRGGSRDMTTLGGWHGWDPASEAMQGIFVATGPGIRKGATIPSFESIHVYPLLAELLALEPAVGIDGKSGLLRRQIEGPPLPAAP
jgi:predicted AlkP superfamily pyrophosphatase or phosphodiesterase